jgi:hypothetical protein
MSRTPDDILREVFDTHATPPAAVAALSPLARALSNADAPDELAALLDRAAERATASAHLRATRQRSSLYTYGSGTETDPSHMLLTVSRELADAWLALLVEHHAQVEVGWPQTFVANLHTRAQQDGGWAYTGRELVHLKVLVNKLHNAGRALVASLEPSP